MRNIIRWNIVFLLTFHAAFSQRLDSVQHTPADLPCRKSVTLVAAGDLLLGARTASLIRTHGIHAPFDSIRSITQHADIALANLEAPFAASTAGEPYPKQYNFKVVPKYAGGLVSAGLDVVTLANNHMMDYGEEALRSTLHVLDSLNIQHAGAGLTFEEAHRPIQFMRNGLTFGFLAYSLTYPDSFWAAPGRGGTAYPASSRMKRQIRELKASNDFVIVSFHWGGEKKTSPKDYQKRYAHQAIDAGADVIIGHHPHVVQGVEVYREKPIAYSLGNFIFGSYSRHANGALLEVEFHPNGKIEGRILPINVNNHEIRFQPRLLRGGKRAEMIRHINDISLALNNQLTPLDSTGMIQLFRQD